MKKKEERNNFEKKSNEIIKEIKNEKVIKMELNEF